MVVESQLEFDWSWVTPRRLQLLGMILAELSEHEIAEEMGISYSTVRSHVEELKRYTGQASVRDIRRWWREAGPQYVAYVARLAGVGEKWYLG